MSDARRFAQLAVALLGLPRLVSCATSSQPVEPAGELARQAQPTEAASGREPEAGGESVRRSMPTEDSELNGVSLNDFKARLKKNGVWSGGSPTKFVGVGRATFEAAIEHGLMPDHRVLDIGAGSLRVGWWFIQYVGASNYYAIEPVEHRILTAVRILKVQDIHLYHNYDFEFPDVTFDFVIARSIWTHASKSMISKMLSEFAENAGPDAKFLASVHLAQNPEQDYLGDEWVGRVDGVSGAARRVHHSLDWIRHEAAGSGLTVQVLDESYSQTWVLVASSSAGS